MPRNRKRKTNIGLHTKEQMRTALLKISGGEKIREVSRQMSISYTTLQRYHKKVCNSVEENAIDVVPLIPNYAVRKIFNDAQEQDLVRYIIKCSQMFYGLTLQEIRKLAYEMAIQNKIKVPQKWHETELAGIDWEYGFRKRHPILSLRTPEGCSLSRATSFNRHNVNLFFDNLQDVMSRQVVFGNGTRLFNLDETSTMTVQKSSKVMAVKGQKQVSKVTSAERGTLVTSCYIVSATGNTLPPVIIFPRVHFKQHMLNDAPVGTLGLAAQSGWMNGQLFVETMRHFITHTNSSKDTPSLLILDNHESHICIEALNLAKDNGVTILTVPPHSTGKMQPLDVAVFGPFKTAYNKAVDSWMMRNPGKTISIYEVAGCVNEAHMKAMTPANICSAFKTTGIFPFDRDVFTDEDFAPSEVTDRPIEQESLRNPTNRIGEDNFGDDENRTRTPSPSMLCAPDAEMQKELPCTPYKSSHAPVVPRSPHTPSMQMIVQQETPHENLSAMAAAPSTSRTSAGQANNFVSPFQFRGLPKAGPRKGGRAPRRKGKSMIATDTPNKLEIENRSKAKNSKKVAKAKKRNILESGSSNEEDDLMSLYSEEEPAFEEDDVEEELVDPDKFLPLQTLPKEGNFILVEFQVKGKKIYYIGKVIGEQAGETEVTFLRKSVKSANKFILPWVVDIATIALEDVKMILPQPGFTGNTKRTQGLYHFDVDFSKIDSVLR